MRVGVILMMACAYAHAAEVSPFLRATWDTGNLRKEFQGRAAEMMLEFWLIDRSHNEGKGASDLTTSGGLAWGEASWLMNYIMCYRAFRDPYWLDKIIDHFDRMRGCLSDPEGDGFLAWRDRDFSVGVVRVIARQQADGLTIDPEVSRIWMNRSGEKVTGHKYSISFPTPDSMVVRDESEGKSIASGEYKGTVTVTEIPGAKFTITGTAKAGARFDLDSVPGEAIEYQVHDGMISYPIAQFIEIVFGDPSLHHRYRKKAEDYLAFIDRHIRQKWEPTWVELPDGCGAYAFTKNITQRFPGGLLPHNQYLALARTFVVLKDIGSLPNRTVYAEKAEKMARYFKKNLRLNGTAYVWNYWDPWPPIPEVRLHTEDTGHGTIDIGFAVEARNRGLVFTDDDMRKFSNTYADVMWNGSTDDPVIAGVVDGRTSKRDGQTIHEWIKLAQWNPKVWDIVKCIYAKNPSAGQVPSILYMVAGMAGMDGSEIARFHAVKAQIEKSLSDGRPWNGDFEMGGVPDRPPFGWTFSVWSRSQGRGLWVEGGHRSKHAILLEGIGGNVNVVAQPIVRTKVTRPTKFRMSVYYRTEGQPRPHFSFLGYEGPTGAPKQYINSPNLPASKDWRRADWEATSDEGVKEVCFLLRNGGVGKVFYDDFEMKVEGP